MSLPLGTLAEKLQAELRGDPNIIIERVSEIQQARPGEITFLSNPKYRKYLETCQASAIILGPETDVDFPNVLIAPNPYLAMVQALELLNHRPRSLRPGIHPTALIADNAQIGEEVEIGPYVVVAEGAQVGPRTILESHVVIGADAQVGAECHLHPHVCLYPGVSVGSRVLIHAGSVIGSDGFGFVPTPAGPKKIPQTGTVVIEDDVEIGANCTIDRATIGQTRIGRGTKLDNLVHIAHNVDVGANCFITAQSGIAGSTTVGNGVQMGGQSGIVGHVKVGNGVSLATRAGVTRNVPDGEIVSGFPARPHREQLRSEALVHRLPELYQRVKKLEQLLSEKE